MRYLAYLEQDGEGCDYTIGCGINVRDFEAEDHDDALKKIKQRVEDNYNYDEARLGHIILYEIKDPFVVDIKEMYKEINMSEQERAEKEFEVKEREELARLKLKYE